MGWPILCIAALLLAACGPSTASTVSPTPFSTPVLALSGQSNAELVKPALASVATVVGTGYGGQQIACWDATLVNQCWDLFARDYAAYAGPAVTAFVWWQGESDQNLIDETAKQADAIPSRAADPAYGLRLPDLLARTRQLLGQPTLRVLVVELGPNQRDGAITAATIAVIQRDINARYVRTNDLPFADGTHMTAAGYTAVAQRIAEAAQAR